MEVLLHCHRANTRLLIVWAWTTAQSMRLIILPQALKISIPGIVNVSVGMLKDTTLVSIISMFDLVGMIRGPVLSSTSEWNWGILGGMFG